MFMHGFKVIRLNKPQTQDVCSFKAGVSTNSRTSFSGGLNQ